MFNENIPNQNVYLQGMEKTLLDKALFMSHIDADIIVDFGCANGALIKFLATLFPNKKFIGYDISYQMIERASLNLKDLDNKYLYFMWEDVMQRINRLKDEFPHYKTCLVCSSVIHEVYAYASSRNEIHNFWTNVWQSGFDYIAIRDMYSVNMEHLTISFEESFKEAVNKTVYSSKLKEFMDKYGSITSVDDFNHFILKYFYTENWERELNENYMPYDGYIHDMTRCVDYYKGYKKIFDIKYVLPYIRKRVFDDFGIELKYPTHYQVIFEKQ